MKMTSRRFDSFLVLADELLPLLVVDDSFVATGQ